MAIVASPRDAALPRVLALVTSRAARPRALMALLAANGFPVSTVTAPERMDGASADVVMACGTNGRAAVALARAVREHVTLPLVMVVSETTPRELRDLLHAGVEGIVLEDDVGRSLAPTLHAVCAGQVVLPGAVWQRASKPVLSTREKQALAMVVMGFSNAEIARQLFVTEATVKSHLSSAFAKLGVRSRAEATARILDPQDGLGTGILAISDDARS